MLPETRLLSLSLATTLKQITKRSHTEIMSGEVHVRNLHNVRRDILQCLFLRYSARSKG